MKWEYQVITKTDLGDFIAWLNRLGDEGWEAISGTYTLGEPISVEISSRIGSVPAPGKPQWVAVMKRQKSN